MVLPLIGRVGQTILRNRKARQVLSGLADGALGFLGTKLAKPKAQPKGVKRSMRFNTKGTFEKEIDSHKEFNRRMREGHKKRGIKVNKRGRASLR